MIYRICSALLVVSNLPLNCSCQIFLLLFSFSQSFLSSIRSFILLASFNQHQSFTMYTGSIAQLLAFGLLVSAPLASAFSISASSGDVAKRFIVSRP